MSKAIKQMQMDALKQTFAGVRDMVVLSVNGLSSQADNQLRHALRKKKVRLLQVKNNLARLALGELGIAIGEDSPYWVGTTTFAWGSTGVADLSRSIRDELANPKTATQYRDKVRIKGGIAEGQTMTFEQMLTMPTREEALANIIALALAPASRLLSQITGPASQLASQIKSLGEKKEEEAAPAAT
jgi:ribosomal protein L10